MGYYHVRAGSNQLEVCSASEVCTEPASAHYTRRREGNGGVLAPPDSAPAVVGRSIMAFSVHTSRVHRPGALPIPPLGAVQVTRGELQLGDLARELHSSLVWTVVENEGVLELVQEEKPAFRLPMTGGWASIPMLKLA